MLARTRITKVQKLHATFVHTASVPSGTLQRHYVKVAKARDHTRLQKHDRRLGVRVTPAVLSPCGNLSRICGPLSRSAQSVEEGLRTCTLEV